MRPAGTEPGRPIKEQNQMTLAIRPGIMDIAAYVPGEHDLPGSGPIHKMSSNESALGASAAAMAAYGKGASELHRYPDGASHALRVALAAEIGGKEDEIICGTGSDDILVLVTRAFAGPGDEVLYSRHGFLVYPIATMANGAKNVVASGLKAPEGIDVAPDGRLIVAEVGLRRIVAIDPKDGAITPLAGNLAIGLQGFQGGPPAYVPTGVAVGRSGTIYVSSDVRNAIYKLTPQF